MISVVRQCELLDLSRSSFYYRSAGDDEESLRLMQMIDEEYTRHPIYGVRRMRAWLRRQSFPVNRKRVSRLMRRMGLVAIYPKPRLSSGWPDHEVHPYLISGITVDRPDQVWAADITYIRLAHGFAYLLAIMDWHSRYVVAWELSTTLDRDSCLEALGAALRRSKPEIFNTDQGPQFTSEAFTGALEGAGIRVSMDGRGRVADNIFLERLWRSGKYEEFYLHEYQTVTDGRRHLAAYSRFYNEERLHEALGYRTPHEAYFGAPAVQRTLFEAGA